MSTFLFYVMPVLSKKSLTARLVYGNSMLFYDARLPDTDEGKFTDPSFIAVIKACDLSISEVDIERVSVIGTPKVQSASILIPSIEQASDGS